MIDREALREVILALALRALNHTPVFTVILGLDLVGVLAVWAD